MTTYTHVSADSLRHPDPNEGVILDVRTAMEHDEKHLSLPHSHVPLDQLNPTDFMMRHGLDHDSTVYLVCRSGKRAAQAAEKFIREGYRNVKVIEGGLLSCEESGHKIKGHGAMKPAADANVKGPISLERQVRIAAGLIAALGASLGLLINPLFTLIPLFVGCGLIYAGATDRCGMALVLAKAPWNKPKKDSCTLAHCSLENEKGPGNKTGQSCQ